ncbi:hypothetical protein PV10_06940 [Exophiala mesophila]|uniref:Uncharacterized protein n=1 Tax=Exophiala mesophila TaxID=212818 RepID=A0A0D1Z476_EXOME|nr:uncharacterized protein PV10_06940 [Exophiala mesophila]KIV89547.1 hypothetical protein PV10_06940 [Exophiala mesophila]
MNVFKKKTKAKDEAFAIPSAKSSDDPPPSKLSRSLKRKQKNVVEPKLELDLATALPQTDDFRTSLLMPGLSARFSMLREQDDPNTKVGKASDDSVLFPKRVSRLNLFSHNPLTDISETDSLKAPYRPPFADTERSQSVAESIAYGSDDGASVMGRSRPVEGNHFFTNRQKTFQAPTASSSSNELDDVQTPLKSDRSLADSDTVPATYQQWRAKGGEVSRERRLSAETVENENGSVVNTPSTGFSKSRGTASSTASGPSNRRTSTAATSVVSDSPVARQSNLSAGSNTRINTNEYGSEDSSLSRNISSESRKGFPFNEDTNQPPLPTSPSNKRPLPHSRNFIYKGDKLGERPPPFLTDAPRTASPSRSPQTNGLASLDFGLNSDNSHHRKFQTASPTTESFEDDAIYVQSLQPNDRGKATALGLFNRPRQPFDEQQFQQRQLQMQQARGLHEGSVNKSAEEAATAVQGRPRSPSSPSTRGFLRGQEKPTSVSNAMRSRSQSSASTGAGHVQSHIEDIIKRQNEEFASFYQAKAPNNADSVIKSPKPSPPMANAAASRGTFYNAFDGSDEEEDMDSPMLGRYDPGPRVAPTDIHPALRDGSQTFDFGQTALEPHDSAQRQSDGSLESSSASALHDTPNTSDSVHASSPTKATDSPTLGPTTGLGLSGLIRTHLRHDSDRSSLAPQPSPRRSQFDHVVSDGIRDRQSSIASTTRTINPPESTHSDPWEFDNAQRSQRAIRDQDAIPTMSQKAQQILGQAISHKQRAMSKAQQVLGNGAPMSEEVTAKPFPMEAQVNHHRGESTETQKEFGNELAERARRIQEGLKGAPDHDRQATSTALARGERQMPGASAFPVLRQKLSKTSLVPSRGEDAQSKAMKILGVGGSLPRADKGNGSPFPPLGGDSDELDANDGYARRPPPRKNTMELEEAGGPSTPVYGRAPVHATESYEDFERSRQRSVMSHNGRGPRGARAESAGGLLGGHAGPGSATNSALPSPVISVQSATDGRAAPLGARKKSVTKGMISDPVFISSTSSVPLVGLPVSPRPGQIATPPVPMMNPRRRGNTMSEKSEVVSSPRLPSSPMPESSDRPPLAETQSPALHVRPRNRLRKTSSEGGSIAAKARNQALLAEFGHERLRSPALPVFPNRSATSLGVHQDGGMF